MPEGNLDSNPTRFVPTEGSSEKDPEAGIRSMVALFRGKIAKLARTTQDPILLSIDTLKLTEDDMHFYNKYEEGNLKPEEIETQLRVLGTMKETDSSRKLLEYFKQELSKESST